MNNASVSAPVSALLVSRAKRYLRGLTDPIRYRLRLHFQPPQNHIYTQFSRFPTQLAVLMDDVQRRLRAGRTATAEAPLEVAVFACCSGDEPYTLAYMLPKRVPGVPSRGRGYDVVPELVEQAKAASYTREHVYSS